MTNETILYSVNETAKLLKINVNRVYGLIHAGLLPAIKIGSYKIRKDTLNNFLEEYEGFDLSNTSRVQHINQ